MEETANGTPTFSDSRSVNNDWVVLFDDAAAKADLRALRDAVEARAREAGFPHQACQDLALAAHEAIVNAIRHGTPSRLEDWVRLDHRVREGYFECRVTSRRTDWALPPPGRPTDFSAPGVGFFLIRTFVDDVTLIRREDHSELILRRRLPGQ